MKGGEGEYDVQTVGYYYTYLMEKRADIPRLAPSITHQLLVEV